MSADSAPPTEEAITASVSPVEPTITTPRQRRIKINSSRDVVGKRWPTLLALCLSIDMAKQVSANIRDSHPSVAEAIMTGTFPDLPDDELEIVLDEADLVLREQILHGLPTLTGQGTEALTVMSQTMCSSVIAQLAFIASARHDRTPDCDPEFA